MLCRGYPVSSAFLVAVLLVLDSAAVTLRERQPAGAAPPAGAEVRKKDLLEQCLESKVWMAYLKDKKGKPILIRDTFGTEDDRDWLGLAFTEFDGPRLRLGVLKVVNKTAEAEANQHRDGIAVKVAGIEEMLTLALYRTNRFDLVERKRIDDVLGEQARKEAYLPSPKEIFNVGKVLGVQYLVYGTINEWIPERSKKGFTGRLGLGRGGGGKSEAEVMMTFTVTDVSNAQILFTTQERAKVGEWAFGIGMAQGDKEGGTEMKQLTPVSYAVQACLNKASFSLAMWLRNRKWKGSVINIKNNEVFVNAGSNHGMRPMMQLAVFSNRGVVIDSEQKGVILGEDTRATGTLEVTMAQPGFSVARVLIGCKGLKKTDRVELADPPEPNPLDEQCNLPRMATTKSFEPPRSAPQPVTARRREAESRGRP